jgi:hypothetical protein
MRGREATLALCGQAFLTAFQGARSFAIAVRAQETQDRNPGWQRACLAKQAGEPVSSDARSHRLFKSGWKQSW